MFKSYLSDIVRVRSVKLEDKWGQKQTIVRNVRCRIEYKNEIVRNMLGDQVVSSAYLHFDGKEIISESDIIIFDNKDHIVLSIQRVRAFYKITSLIVKVA